MTPVTPKPYLVSRPPVPAHTLLKRTAWFAVLAVAAYGVFDGIDRQLTVEPISAVHAAAPVPVASPAPAWYDPSYYRFPDDAVNPPAEPVSTF